MALPTVTSITQSGALAAAAEILYWIFQRFQARGTIQYSSNAVTWGAGSTFITGPGSLGVNAWFIGELNGIYYLFRRAAAGDGSLLYVTRAVGGFSNIAGASATTPPVTPVAADTLQLASGGALGGSYNNCSCVEVVYSDGSWIVFNNIPGASKFATFCVGADLMQDDLEDAPWAVPFSAPGTEAMMLLTSLGNVSAGMGWYGTTPIRLPMSTWSTNNVSWAQNMGNDYTTGKPVLGRSYYGRRAVLGAPSGARGWSSIIRVALSTLVRGARWNTPDGRCWLMMGDVGVLWDASYTIINDQSGGSIVDAQYLGGESPAGDGNTCTPGTFFEVGTSGSFFPVRRGTQCGE